MYPLHMDAMSALTSLAIALGLGLLVGLQRELAESRVAGFRTFALVTVLGTLAAFAAQQFGGWIIGAGLIGVAAATAMGDYKALQSPTGRGPGITTEIAVLVMFLVGVVAAQPEPGSRQVAVAVGVAVAVLLQAKERLHNLATKLGEGDLRAILLFAAITFIVLPILPDEAYGPYDVWNPRILWLMVVLVVGISLAGYIAYKFAGPRAGTALTGLIGGLISSTAVTLSFSKRAASSTAARNSAVLAIALASAVLYGRILVEIAAVGPQLLRHAAWPIGAMLGASLAAAAIVYLRAGLKDAAVPEQSNPTELRTALVFALLFGVVLLAVAWARDVLGGAGIYAVAALSGIHDMDAITLSSARLVQTDALDAPTAWRAIVLAAIANMIFKAALAGMFGGAALFWRIAAIFAPAAAVGLLFFLFWPTAPA